MVGGIVGIYIMTLVYFKKTFSYLEFSAKKVKFGYITNTNSSGFLHTIAAEFTIPSPSPH